MPERRVSYAQNGEDVRLWRALRHVEEPFYIEVGASHPYDDSVTAALSAEGWHGVLLEPDTALVDLLREARPRDVVVGAAAHSRAGVLTFDPGTERGLGATSPDGSLSVPAVRIADVLEDLAPSAVHAMVVDVEGGERAALLGAGLEQWRPWILCVEATAPNSRVLVHDAWEPLVLEAGYRYVAFDGLNRWYVADERSDLAPAVGEPFGVLDHMLDGWVRRAEVELQDRARDLERETDERLAQERQQWEQRLAHERQQAEQRLAHERQQAEQRLAHERQQAAGQVEGLRTQLEQLRSALEHMSAQHDQALERAAVMLRSKSWRVTAPLRTVRWRAGLALAARRSTPTVQAPAPASLPGDDRRWEALRHRLEAARRSRS